MSAMPADVLHILSIVPGPTPPDDDPALTPYDYLPPGLHADVLQTCWGDRRRFPSTRYDRPNVRYHFTYSNHVPGLLKLPWDILFFVGRGLSVYLAGRRFKVIFVYGPTKTALAGLLLKWITGAKLIVAFGGDPRTAFVADSERPSPVVRLKHGVSHWWTRLLLRGVDRLKLLFPEQVDIYPEAARIPKSVFADFVAVSAIRNGGGDERYVLLLGYPWYLKGVDLLIKAFQIVAPQFPDYVLKVVGHCSDRTPWEALRAGSDRIEFYPGVYHPEALELIAHCTVLVLPSRTESMGRVLLEAMAAGKPVIASRVGGIPYYVRHDETGLLFESENVEELAGRLRDILESEPLRRRLGENAFRRVQSQFGEPAFGHRFAEMIHETLERPGAPPVV